MNIIAIFYATLIAFFSGIVFTNYSKIERLTTNMLISLDAYSIGYIMAKIILGVVYLSLTLTLYRLVKANKNKENPNLPDRYYFDKPNSLKHEN